jgi:hypothetical protein
MKWNNKWSMKNSIDDYAIYDYMNVYLRYGFADISTGGLFDKTSKNVNEDLFKFLDLDVVD